jgi:hypothetical protein
VTPDLPERDLESGHADLSPDRRPGGNWLITETHSTLMAPPVGQHRNETAEGRYLNDETFVVEEM